MKSVFGIGGGIPVRPINRILIIGFAFLATGHILAAQTGRVVYMEGDVLIYHADGTNVPAAIGVAVARGDTMQTGSDGLAVVDLTNGAVVKLREETILAINSLTSATLLSGGAFAAVERIATSARGRRFELRTPSVVAGVRGTQFFMAYGRAIEDSPDVWLCVNEGVVSVAVPSTGQKTLVNEGEGVNILAGNRVTNPRFFPWTTELNWNFDPADGAVRDQTSLDSAYADLLDQDYD